MIVIVVVVIIRVIIVMIRVMIVSKSSSVSARAPPALLVARRAERGVTRAAKHGASTLSLSLYIYIYIYIYTHVKCTRAYPVHAYPLQFTSEQKESNNS